MAKAGRLKMRRSRDFIGGRYPEAGWGSIFSEKNSLCGKILGINIKAVIFDRDGVVVFNHDYHFKAWMEFADRYGFELDEEIYRDQFNGRTNKELFQMIFDD